MDIQSTINSKESRIIELKFLLSNTDYQNLKRSEGYKIDDEVFEERVAWRGEINLLEDEIEVLKEQLKEESELPKVEEI